MSLPIAAALQWSSLKNGFGRSITILQTSLKYPYPQNTWALIVCNFCLKMNLLKTSLDFPFWCKQDFYVKKKKKKLQKRCVPLYEPWSNGSAQVCAEAC